MTTFNTGNPIGSAAAKDLYDNAENLDEFVNSDNKLSHPDRLGVERKTWHGMEQDFQAFLANSGYIGTGVGGAIEDYAAGIEITAYNQVIRDGGELWRLSAGTSLPYTTTGAGMPEGGSFVSVGDAVLRQELAGDLTSGQGGLMVAGGAIYATTLSGLTSIPHASLPQGRGAFVSSTGRSGEWWWDNSDHSASGTGLVDSDPNEIAIAAPSSDASGASGAWRRSDLSNVTPEMAGAVGDGVADDTQPCQAWMEWLIQNNVKVNRPTGKYLVTQIDVDGADNLVISGGHWKMKYEVLGSLHHIFNVQNSNAFFTANGVYEGTSGTSATYNSTEMFGGMLVQNSSFCGSFYCEYKNFTSWGIRANQLNGGTETEGLLVFGCRFLDFPLDTATVQQCGVRLDEDGEYSRVANCWFYRIPSAARFVDAANSAFKDNIVMGLNGEALNASAGAFYSEFTSPGNGNKIQVTGNKFNHIETGQYIVVMKGDPAKPQNENLVCDNEVLVSGLAGINNRLIVLVDCPGSKVINNNLRAAGVSSLHGLIRLNKCDGAIIDGNSLISGDYAIELQDSSDVYIGDSNTYQGQASGKILRPSSTVRITSNRSLVFRITSAGALGFGDTDGISVVRNSAGNYTVTHNFGSSDYGVFFTTDNISPAPGRFYSVVRSDNSFDISVRDPGGSSVDQNMLVIMHLAQSNPHII